MNAPSSSPFSDNFFCVTARSIYEVNLQIRDPISSLGDAPVLRKIAMRPGHGNDNGRTPGWYVRGKFHLAITPDGIKRYSLIPHQRESTGRIPLPDISMVDPKLRSLGTGPIVGLFLNRAAADACHECSDRGAVVFDPQWLGQTSEVLARITDRHPLISISATTHDLMSMRAKSTQK